jgi:hypothetical protein
VKYNITNCSKNNGAFFLGKRHLNPGKTSYGVDEKEFTKSVWSRINSGELKITPCGQPQKIAESPTKAEEIIPVETNEEVKPDFTIPESPVVVEAQLEKENKIVEETVVPQVELLDDKPRKKKRKAE